MPQGIRRGTGERALIIGPFDSEQQKSDVLNAVLSATDADVGRARHADKPLAVLGTNVNMSCAQTGKGIEVGLEGPETELGKARKKIEDKVTPFGVNVMVSIHQEKKHGHPR